MKLNFFFLLEVCCAFIILKNISRITQSNEESEEDSVSTSDDTSESSSENSPEDDDPGKIFQERPIINQLPEKGKENHTKTTSTAWRSSTLPCANKLSC